MRQVYAATVILLTAIGVAVQAQQPAEQSAVVRVQHADAEDDAPAPTIRITSPLGRTGVAGKVRIVAQVEFPEGRPPLVLPAVRFTVDGVPIGGTVSGPPYAVEWDDENPFEQREILAELEEASGRTVRDVIVLPPFEIDYKTGIRSVLLDTGVYDGRGRPVANLEDTAFTIYEDDTLQTIDVVSQRTTATTMALLVDNSQSMGRRMPAVRAAAGKLAKNLAPGDQVIVVPFNHHVGSITGPTNDVATAAEAIDAMHAEGGTALLDAVVEAVRLLDGAAGSRALVLITDGFDENSTTPVADAVKQANVANVTIYAVGIGGVAGVSMNGESTLRQLANGTGGRVFFPWRDTDLLGVSAEISLDAHSRYFLTYTPTNQKADGTWRTIAVQAGPGHVVRTQPGYLAPAPPPIRPTIEFSITDPEARSVEVGPGDIDVLEDGVPQAVDAFQEAVDPVSLVIALDASGSMRRSVDLAREAGRQFVLALRPQDQLALVTFADQPQFGHVLGTNRDYSFLALDQYRASGGTALYDALWTSLMHVKTVPGRKAVVVLSDGKDENAKGTAPGSTHTLEDVVTLAREIGAAIFPVGLGTAVEHRVLEHVAQESGGVAHFSPDSAQLADRFRRVVDNLRHRYVLSYTSTNPIRSTAWRKVEVRPRQGGLVVSSLGGYVAADE